MNPARQKRKYQAHTDKREINSISIRDIRSENNAKNVLTSVHGKCAISPIPPSAGDCKLSYTELRHYLKPNRLAMPLLQ